jgi:hypothetical protein
LISSITEAAVRKSSQSHAKERVHDEFSTLKQGAIDSLNFTAPMCRHFYGITSKGFCITQLAQPD